MGGAQDPGAAMGRGGFGLRETGKAAQMGTPPSAHRGQSQWKGMGVTFADLPPVHHSSLKLCFCDVWAFSANFPSSGALYSYSLRLSFQLTAVPSLGLHCKPHFSAPALTRQQETQLKLGFAALQRGPCTQFLLALPSTDYLLHSPLIP